MPEKVILNQGLSLIANSPFKSSLPKDFRNSPQIFNYDKVIRIAKDSNLSDTDQFLKSKNLVKELYHSQVGSTSLTKNESLSATLQAEIAEDYASGHLKIKLLTEYALAQVKDGEKLLSLAEIQSLQKKLGNLIENRTQIEHELRENFTTIKSFSSSSSRQLEEWNAIQKIITLNESLCHHFDNVAQEIQNTTETINHQYILAFSLCYFEDFNIEVPSVTQPKNDRETDELLSHIASIAVQKNVILPTPSSTSEDDSKVEWAKSCLDTLLSHNTDLAGSREVKPRSIDNEDEITHLKTALKDLQFAHQYLTRQYEDESNLNSSVIYIHKNKKAALEKQLSENLTTLEKANQRSILIEHEKNVLEKAMDDKNKEIYDLQKQVALLKIDNLGYIHNDNQFSKFANSSPEKNIPVSPVTGITVSTFGGNSENNNSRSNYYSNPKTPLLQQNINNYRTASPSSPKFSSSISVLRNEFKKLVNEMHDGYKTELEKEKAERKRLEHLLKLYVERSSDIDL